MRVGEVMQTEVLSADPEETLLEVAGRMQSDEIGSFAVFQGRRLVGIITERDLVRAMADGADPEQTTVREYMTPDPVTVTPDATIPEVAALMLEHGFRHMPVVEGPDVVAILSARDLLFLEAWVKEERAG